MENIDKLLTVADVEAYRAKLNEECDKRIAFINKCNKANALSCENFGSIKENMENISHLLFSTKEGGSLLGKYIATIKNSKALSSMHTLYEEVRKANGASDINYFISEISTENWDVDKKELNEGLKELGGVLSSAYMLLGEDADEYLTDGDKTLNEAIEFIATNKKTKKNIAEYSKAVKVIEESIEKAKPETTTEQLVREFNEKYEGKLTDEEMAVVNEIKSGKNCEEVFNSYKEKITNALSENKDNIPSEKIASLNEQLAGKTFSEETFCDDIINLSGIYRILES